MKYSQWRRNLAEVLPWRMSEMNAGRLLSDRQKLAAAVAAVTLAGYHRPDAPDAPPVKFEAQKTESGVWLLKLDRGEQEAAVFPLPLELFPEQDGARVDVVVRALNDALKIACETAPCLRYIEAQHAMSAASR